MIGIEAYELIKNLDLHALMIESATDAEDEMVKANEDQLSRGVRADDTDIAPPYTYFTIQQKELKSGLAGITDVVTLFDTGAHYAALFAKVNGDEIEWGSNDSKSPALQEKYGDEIYGLSLESREFLIEDYLFDRFAGKVERALALK